MTPARSMRGPTHSTVAATTARRTTPRADRRRSMQPGRRLSDFAARGRRHVGYDPHGRDGTSVALPSMTRLTIAIVLLACVVPASARSDLTPEIYRSEEHT